MKDFYPKLPGKRRLIIVLFGAAIAGLIIFATIKRAADNQGLITAEIIAVPGDAAVYVDEKNVRPGKIKLPPGTHTFTAKKDGFSDVEQKIDLTRARVVTLILTPQSEEARRWALENSQEYLAAERRAGERAVEAGETLLSSNPIVRVLPYKGALFNIDYRLASDNSGRVVLQVSATSSENRYFAIERIRSLGYEPTDYVIEFSGLPTKTLLEQR